MPKYFSFLFDGSCSCTRAGAEQVTAPGAAISPPEDDLTTIDNKCESTEVTDHIFADSALSNTEETEVIDRPDGAVFYEACETGDLDRVNDIINPMDGTAKQMVINWVNTNKNGSTPLDAAAEKGFVDIVNLLLQEGANINMPDAVRGPSTQYDDYFAY